MYAHASVRRHSLKHTPHQVSAISYRQYVNMPQCIPEVMFNSFAHYHGSVIHLSIRKPQEPTMT